MVGADCVRGTGKVAPGRVGRKRAGADSTRTGSGGGSLLSNLIEAVVPGERT